MRLMRTMLVVAFSFFAAKVHAQQGDARASSTFEIPSEPLVHTAPAYSQWIMTFSYLEDQKEIPGTPSGLAKPTPENVASRPRTVITTKTGEIIHEETVTVGGQRLENWQVDGSCYTKFPGKNFWSAYEKYAGTQLGSNAAISMILPESGFRGLDWINKKTYAGKIKTGSGYCLVFVPGGRATVEAGNPDKQKALDLLPTVAYVDAETHLPVMVRVAGETRVFKFAQPPPASIQSLPSDLAEEIRQGDEIRAKRNAAPRQEY
jgi:hypothetical protein